jgi:hypothetical protein
MNKFIVAAIFAGALLTGCATADKLNQIHVGMAKDQVVSILGAPDSTSATANMEYFTYYLIGDSTYGRDQPYMIRFVDNKVESFGRFLQLYDAYNRPAVRSYPSGTTAPVATIRQAAPVDLATEIQRLQHLKDAGALTEDEFQKAKATLLIGGTTSAPRTDLTPAQAILAVAERPEGVTGTFKMEIRGGGRQNDWLYLNSEADYRDQRCLVIALPNDVALELERRIGGDPAVLLKGKTIRVSGTAMRTTIWFIVNGQTTDKYYYQTQVRLTDASQLIIIP